MANYDVFISGELMDLCCPSEAAIHEDAWHTWFNDPVTTRYIKQGLYPNTKQDQLDFLNSVRKNKDRLLLLIRPKGLEKVVGVTSLSGIDHVTRSAMSAMVIGDRNYKAKYKELIGIEARSRLLEHAFDKMGLERVSGSQLTDLRKWQSWQVLFGYRVEGLQREAFRKGQQAHDIFVGSVLLKDYLHIRALRDGNYWPGAKRMMELLRLLPKNGFEQVVEDTLNKEWDKYYSSTTLAGGHLFCRMLSCNHRFKLSLDSTIATP